MVQTVDEFQSKVRGICPCGDHQIVMKLIRSFQKHFASWMGCVTVLKTPVVIVVIFVVGSDVDNTALKVFLPPSILVAQLQLPQSRRQRHHQADLKP